MVVAKTLVLGLVLSSMHGLSGPIVPVIAI